MVVGGRRWSPLVNSLYSSSTIYRPFLLLKVAFLQQEKVEIDLPPHLIAAATYIP